MNQFNLLIAKLFWFNRNKHLKRFLHTIFLLAIKFDIKDLFLKNYFFISSK